MASLEGQQKQEIQILLSCLNYLYKESMKSNLPAVGMILIDTIHSLNQWMESGKTRSSAFTSSDILDEDFLDIFGFFHTYLQCSKEQRQEFLDYLQCSHNERQADRLSYRREQ